MKTDAKIEEDIIRELSRDTRTSNLGVNTDVQDGIVTLTGVVPSYAEKIAVQDAAHRVNGVLDVANEILIKVRRPFDDEEIAHAVRQALQWDATVPDDQITSTVSDGWVTLAGNVNTLRQRSDAEWVVENLMGVKGVINEIKVVTPTVNADELKTTIMDALERRADREAERLQIDVKDGEVDLYGRVHSWQERKAVVGSIIPTPGVRKINDKLRVDPYF